ncbi:ABC transporter permease [Fervidobacterium sp.]
MKWKIGLGIITVFVIMAIFAPLLSKYEPNRTVNLPYQPPSSEHWLGTDRMGRDILSQVFYGARLSLTIGISTGLIMTAIATVVGMISGYYGGLVDRILSTITDIFLVIPGLPLMIVISSYMRVRGPLMVILVIAFTSWGSGARIIRAQMLSLRNREFTLAAKVIGENNLYTIFVELLPNMLSLTASIFFSSVLYAIIGEASLSFLGLSDVSKITWGTMLYWAQNANALLNGMWYWVLAPGLCIVLLGTAFALISFSIDEITNPRLRSK